MSIKRLIQSSAPSTRMNIHPEMGLLLIEKNDGRFECLYLDSPNKDELSKLTRYKNLRSVKYVGGEKTLLLIKELRLEWPSYKREIIINSKRQAVFYTETGKVRIEKQIRSEIKLSESKKKVLIIDDSKTVQKLLKKIIESSSELEVMGIADRPSAAKKILEKEKPDLITLDVHMPEMNGVEFFKSYLKKLNIPTFMISSISINEGPLVMEALSEGVINYIQKPSVDKIAQIAPEIVQQLESSYVKTPETPSSLGKAQRVSVQFEDLEGLIAIGSSTGGTQALQQIFERLPSEIPPIVVVQHIPAVFSKALADRLNDLNPFTVKEAEDGEEIRKNTIYIAPGGNQMKLRKTGDKYTVEINDDPPLNRFKPSVDYLFNTIPSLNVSRLVGLILTGMGKDGAEGLLKLKQSGAYTIAQDKKSSVVFGMPKEAIRIGAACVDLPLEDIVQRLVIEYNRLSVFNKKIG